MAIYIEKRSYNKKKFAEMLGVNPNDSKHLNRNLQRKLEGMGFKEDDYQILRSEVVILWVPTTAEEKIPYLCRLLGIDKQVDAINFTVFCYCLLEQEDFQCRPWPEKAIWIKDCYGVDVTDRTLRAWCSKLMNDGEVVKDKDTFSWWTSTNINGDIIREEVMNEQEIEDYRNWNKEFFEREDVQKMDKKERGETWFSSMWGHFGCKFYKCYAYTFGAWHGDIMEELIKVGKEYIEKNFD